MDYKRNKGSTFKNCNSLQCIFKTFCGSLCQKHQTHLAPNCKMNGILLAPWVRLGLWTHFPSPCIHRTYATDSGQHHIWCPCEAGPGTQCVERSLRLVWDSHLYAMKHWGLHVGPPWVKCSLWTLSLKLLLYAFLRVSMRSEINATFLCSPIHFLSYSCKQKYILKLRQYS